MNISTVNGSDLNQAVDDYYFIQCLDGKTGEAKDACVDWAASPIPCSNYYWPCADLEVEG